MGDFVATFWAQAYYQFIEKGWDVDQAITAANTALTRYQEVLAGA